MIVHIIQLDTIGKLQSSNRFQEISSVCIAEWQRGPHEIRVWRNNDLYAFPLVSSVLSECTNLAQVADVWRLELLSQYGGLYVDADMWPIQVPALKGLVLCCEDPHSRLSTRGLLSNAFVHAERGQLVEIAQQCAQRVNLKMPTNEATGPAFLTRALDSFPVQVLATPLCFPVIWGKTSAELLLARVRAGEFATSWVVHLWLASWKSEIVESRKPD